MKSALEQIMTKFILQIGILEPDTARDIVYCGDGNDEVWVNTGMDEDEVNKDCEILHKG